MLDFRPAKRNIAVPAGDSLSITVTVNGIENLTNPVFTGRVQGSATVFEDFVVDATATGAVLRLTPTQTRALFDSGAVQTILGPAGSTAEWEGQYDLQLVHDPEIVRTFLSGKLLIEGDVAP